MKKHYFSKNSNKSFMPFCIIFCALFANSAMAQKNIGWTGAANTDWYNAANWNYPAITSVGTYDTSSATVTLTAANNDIAVGDKVAGYGIPAGATVTAIDATKKVITISLNTYAKVGTPGTNVVFTFATPKATISAPSVVDIALISNGANLTLAAGTYYLAGLTVSNQTGPVTGSTLTIPANAEVLIESSTNEGILIKGGNIVNNGILDIKSFLTEGSNNTAGAYGMVFGLPDVLPTVPTEYVYSGSGSLKIDTSAGNNSSGAILFNGADANAGNATYKLLFNGTTNFALSSAKASNGNASTHCFRAVGSGALQAPKVIIGGAGFDMGDSSSGTVNGLVAVAGGGIDFTIAQGTTINLFSDANNGNAFIQMYVIGGTSIPAFIKNKGTINIKGLTSRHIMTGSAQNNGVVNFVNDGVLDIDVKSVAAGQAGFSIGNNSGATAQADVNLINNNIMTIKTMLNGVSAGTALNMTTNSGAPNFHVINNGTLNLIGSNYNFGSKVFNPDPANTTQTGTSRITNSGTINTNQELRSFYTVNNSTGKINFTSTTNPLKLGTFTVATAVAATAGSTYTDTNMNVYTVVLTKVTGTGTTLITHFAANIANPTTNAASVGPPAVPASSLTKTSGTGDATIIFTSIAGNSFNATLHPTLNSGTISSNPGITVLTGVTGITTPAATSVLSPGGDLGNGLMNFAEVTADLLTLRGTLKIGATGSTTAGVDYDALKMNGNLDLIDISAAILDVTGIYKPTVATTIDIITTNTKPAFEGGVLGEFASVVGLPAGWSVVYTGGLGGKVQLAYDPNLGTAQFSDFKFSVYPNPTSSELNVSAAQNISKVELFNILGQRVLSENVQSTQKQLNISNLQKGIYVMEVTIDEAKESYKIIKQ